MHLLAGHVASLDYLTMNTATIKYIKSFQSRFTATGSVLDVGSMCVNGAITGRQLWPHANYTGCDIASGNNVDVVVESEAFDLCRAFDVVVSSSCAEHVRRPWAHFGAISQHLKPGGFLVFTAPFAFHYHRYPIDCWRYTPDSFETLCQDSGLEVVECRLINSWPWKEMTPSWAFWNLWQQFYKGIRHIECCGIARKK